MKNEITEQQVNAILEALDKAITKGPWEDSNFLRVIGKKLREIRDNFSKQTANHYSAEKAKKEAHLISRVVPSKDNQEIFISLYTSEGDKLPAWERVLANLPRQIISRPVYAEEKDVRYLIKSKENRVNEAYVAIFVDKNNILPVAPDKVLLDKFGKPLLSLKDKSVNLENVHRFVHLSGSYHYFKGRLIKNLHAE